MIRSLFKLVRLPNVLMVVLTMYLMRWSVVRPILQVNGLELQVPEWVFLLLVLSTVILTSAGYVINDYHDVKSDRINHPLRVVIDHHVSRRAAMKITILLNTLGSLLGIFVSLYLKVAWLAPLFILVPIILWGYSAFLKHQAILGNMTVALLTGFVPLLVILFEYPLLHSRYSDFLELHPGGLTSAVAWISAFAFFAFMMTMVREVIKDAEDVEGDSEVNSRTLPVLKGIVVTRIVIVILSVITLGCISYLSLRYLTDWISLVYFGAFMVLPFSLLIFKVLKTRQPKDFRSISLLAKLIMLFGLLYAPVAQWLITLYLR